MIKFEARNKEKMRTDDVLVVACVAVVVAVFVFVAILFVILLVSTPQTVPLHAHVYALPKNLKRTGLRTWASTESNGTVRGVFVVFAATEEQWDQEGRCCEWIGGTLKKGMPFTVEAQNDGTFSPSTILAIADQSVSRWESVAGNMIGTMTVGESEGFVLNGVNSIGMGALDVPVSNALAVTALWQRCTTGGRIDLCPRERLEIFEWKMSFDMVNREWAIDGRKSAWDVLTTFLHEFGHVFGIGHSGPLCRSSVMSPTLQKGETKRILDEDSKNCAMELYETDDATILEISAAILFFTLMFI